MKIGPSFQSELNAAGVGTAPVVWTADGVMFDPSIDPDTRATVESVIARHDPTKPGPEPVTVVSAIDLYRRMTDAEYSQMQAGLATQPPRVQGIFARAVTFRSDAEEWPLLATMARQLYGDTRAAELLEPDRS